MDIIATAIDIFALGCVSYYTMTGGEHPFGTRSEREGKIERGDPPSLNGLSLGNPNAAVLISQMVAADSTM